MMDFSADERKVRERIEAWAHAVRSHDLEGVVAYHTQDIVYFDVPAPPEVRGLDGYRRSWPPFFEYIGESGQFELARLEISAGRDVAFAHALLLVRGSTETKVSTIRLSVGLLKRDGEWWVTHEHHSAPYEGNVSVS
jgi:ketosteroid isomerase-like protein